MAFFNIIIWLVFLLPVHCFADDTSSAAPEQPDLPMPVQSGEELEPDITIVRKGDQTIQEYRRNGQLYMIKIVPQVGPAYYMLDINGDGVMDVRKNDLDKTTNINMWNLFNWNWP